jgi:hypothetical protein
MWVRTRSRAARRCPSSASDPNCAAMRPRVFSARWTRCTAEVADNGSPLPKPSNALAVFSLIVGSPRARPADAAASSISLASFERSLESVRNKPALSFELSARANRRYRFDANSRPKRRSANAVAVTAMTIPRGVLSGSTDAADKIITSKPLGAKFGSQALRATSIVWSQMS